MGETGGLCRRLFRERVNSPGELSAFHYGKVVYGVVSGLLEQV